MARVALTLAVVLVAAMVVGAGDTWAADPLTEGKSAFWQEREADYRSSERGPLTAIHAEYLGYRGEANLYVVDGELVAEPDSSVRRGQGLRVNFARPGFVVAPVIDKRFDYPRMLGSRIRDMWFVGPEAGDSLDVRVGPLAVSLDMQDEKTGRVVVYDPARLADFPGFDVFPEDERFRVEARVSPADGVTLSLGTSRGLAKDLVRAVSLDFTVGGEDCRLFGFRDAGETEGSVFVPFRDATSGDESYGVGRYLRVVPDSTGHAIVDFNRATNPWCAYSPHYNCVLPPPENDLAVAIRAGERVPAGH